MPLDQKNILSNYLIVIKMKLNLQHLNNTLNEFFLYFAKYLYGIKNYNSIKNKICV